MKKYLSSILITAMLITGCGTQTNTIPVSTQLLSQSVNISSKDNVPTSPKIRLKIKYWPL